MIAHPSWRLRAGNAPLFLWVPALAIAAAMLLPTLYLIVRATEGGSDAWDILRRHSTADLLVRSIFLATAVTIAAVVISLPMAWLTVRTDLPLRRFWAVVLALPLVIPSYVGAFAMVSALGPTGLLRDALSPIGVDRLPDIYGFRGAWLVLTLFTYPYVFLTLQATLRHLNPALEEASRGLGHGSVVTYFRVVLPQLRPAAVSGALLVALYTLSDFGAVSLLRFNSFTRVIYIQYRSSFDRTGASVLALLLVALTIAILAMEARTRGRARYYSGRSGGRRKPALVHLGRWRWPACAACALLALAALGVPLTVICYWLIHGLREGESLSLVWEAAWNAVRASALAAALAAAAAIPIAFLTIRHPNPFTAVLERLAYLGFALPGIVVALALVFFSVRYATPMYQTLLLLIFAYVMLYLPQALGAVRASLLQLSPSIEEAARSLGRPPFAVMATITLPLVRPGLMSGAALVFLTAMKELPATLLLGPTGYDTLATVIWSNTSEALFTRAAAASLLLIVVAAVPMAVMVLSQGRTRR